MWRSCPLALAFTALLRFALNAQQWSPAQQEVWRTVETYWELNAGEDAEGFLSYVHDEFTGWTNGQDLPRAKADMARYMPEGFANRDIVEYAITPAGIVVHGDLAIVHYRYDMTLRDAAGAERHDRGRWTDILVREGSWWLMIGDHGGSDGG